MNGLAIGWKIMCAVGLGAVVTGLQLLFDSDPHIRTSGMSLAALTLGYIGANVSIHLTFGDTTYFPLVFSQLVLALVGLALPLRRIFRQVRSEAPV